MSLVDILDLAGVAAFAASGAVVALRREMDIVGVIALSVVTGVAGGVIRDLLIGDVPPHALQQARYLLTPIIAALIATAAGPRVLPRLRYPLELFDAVGLGLFAAVGAERAGSAGVPVPGSIAVGVVAAVGGGLLRDVLAAERPQIFIAGSQLYAIPAALGAAAVAVASTMGWPVTPVIISAVAATTALRLLAVALDWHAPVPRLVRSE